MPRTKVDAKVERCQPYGSAPSRASLFLEWYAV